MRALMHLMLLFGLYLHHGVTTEAASVLEGS
jgi:hypothetical protein